MIDYSARDRVPVDLILVAGDSPIARYDCYADWAGLARKLKPKAILELGAYLGWSACAMLHGAGKPYPIYRGMDGEIEMAGSNELALENIRGFCRGVDAAIFHVKFPDGRLPEEILRDGPYQLVNVDADHTREGTLATLLMAWPFLARGGVLTVDDTVTTSVKTGVEDFMRQIDALGDDFDRMYLDNHNGWVLIEKR